MRARHLLPRAVLVLIAAARAVGAADLPLSAEMEPVALSARGGAPIPVVWRLVWNGGGLLEGRLQLTIRDNAGVLARVRIEDVVLSGSEQRFRAMLPALGFSNVYQQLSVRAAFETGQQSIDLGEFLLNVPGQWQRQFGMCVCTEWDLSDPPSLRKFAEGLQIEQFHPERDLLNASLALREINTSVSRFSPDDMPTDPLVYCAFNLVVLDAVGFAEMQPRQIEALRQWIDAGGNVCVFAHGDLKAPHLDLLNALAGAGQDAYLRDSQGRLMTIEDAEDQVRLSRYGLGRAAILRGTPDDWQDIEPEPWRQIAAWLWHVRRDQRPFFIRDGHWEPRLIRPVVPGEWGGTAAQPGQPLTMQALSPMPLQSGYQLLNRLMPEDIEVVPLSLIGLILFFYVLLIGPADYFVLGWLRQRKWTWVAFPAITVGATLLTVWLSQVYLGTSTARRTVTFADIGEKGMVARTSRFELLFTGTAQEIRTDVSQSILTPLDHQRLGGVMPAMPSYGNQATGSDLLVGPATYAGRIPARYTVAQDLPQWTPQVNRLFAIAPQLNLPAVDWDAVRNGLRSMARSTEIAPEIQQQLSVLGPNAAVYVFNGEHTYVRNAARSFFPGQQYAPASGSYSTAPNSATFFLAETSVSNRSGLFSLLSSVPPTAGSSFEDLVLLDPSNPNEWLLVVVVENGDDLTIYRKLYVQN